MSEMSLSPALRNALDELHAGNGAKGEEIVILAIRQAEATHGAVSAEHAAALFDAGQFFAVIGDYRRAASTFRKAAEIKVPGDEAVKQRLTYLRHVGEMLRYAGDLDAAEKVLKEGLEERRSYYGAEHAGYAFGLEPLAEVVWLQGRPGEAHALIKEAVENLWRNENPQVFSVLALLAFVHHAAGVEGGAFEGLPPLADADIDHVIEHTLFRATHLPDDNDCRPALEDLYEWVSAARGPNHPSLVSILAKVAERARLVEDSDTQSEALARLIEVCRSNNDTEQAIKAVQALALVHDAAGRVDEADARYRLALEWAREFGDPQRLSQVLRNRALFLREHERIAEAEALLHESIALGKTAQDAESQGRALVALGILVQHTGRLDEAQRWLEEAIAVLPRAHPDLLFARSHLNAIVRGGSCGCGNMNEAYSETLRALVDPSLPDGLIDELRVDPDGGVHVQLSRAPEGDEQELLSRVLDHAVRAVRAGIRHSGYS
ncbi:MAG: tetratricopeptide repeat protein [Isosphaeraceae bacterium]